MLEQPRYFSIIPPNMAKMRQYQGADVPQPSVEHTLVKCDRCGGDGWIGPGQLAGLTFGGGTKICYWCLFKEMQDNPANLEMHAMDREADLKPRRT
jgi:hypothetical protein